MGRIFQEFHIKACKEVRFAHGGHIFAAVNLRNILLFSSYTFEKIGVLISHTALVKSICWSPDDSRLVSAGVDGAVYEWSVHGCSRVEENVMRNVRYSSVVYNGAGNSVIACGDDKRLREVCNSNVTKEGGLDGDTPLHVLLGNNDKVLFVG